MKIKFAIICIAVGTVLAPIVSHATDQDLGSKRTMAADKDPALAAKVKARLAEEKFSSLPTVNIDADVNGAVVLSGRVKSEQEADKIVYTVKRLEGVKAVKSIFNIPADK